MEDKHMENCCGSAGATNWNYSKGLGVLLMVLLEFLAQLIRKYTDNLRRKGKT